MSTSRSTGVPLLATPRSERVAWKWAGAAAVAAAVVIGAVALFLQERTALAKGETVVREARQAHAMPIDRCYLVEVRRESSLVAELSPADPQVRQTRLWTRGDRFWVESVRPEQRWAWGRDEANRFWIAFGPHTAVRIEAGEVPFWLNVYCDLHSLNFEKWLGEVLNRFELTRETKARRRGLVDHRGSRHGPRHVRRAVSRSPYRRARDRRPDAGRAPYGRPADLERRPFATVTYTLAETDCARSDRLPARGASAEPFEIYSATTIRSGARRLLARWFGPRSGRRFRTLEPVK